MLLKRLRETGVCSGPDGARVLRVDIYQGAGGVWELELRQLDGSGRIVCRYNTDSELCSDLRLVRRYGPEHGTWEIQTASDHPGFLKSMAFSRPGPVGLVSELVTNAS